MSEPELTHQVIGLKGRIKIRFVDTERHSHEHVLRALNSFLAVFQKIGALESPQTEIVVVVVASVVNTCLYQIDVFLDDFEDIVGEHGCGTPNLVLELLESLGDLKEIRRSHLVQVGH